MENEKIYVLVPVYNVEAYLERCIDSILNQTYQNWELVLVNDGSKDNSGAICDRYAAEHENITVIHQENGGVSVARNTAVSYALEHGDHNRDWISFVDSDDFVHPKYLEYLHRAAKEAGTDISCCGFLRSESIEMSWPDTKHLIYECCSPESFFCKKSTSANIGCSKLYHLALFKKIRYPESKIYEDDSTTHKLLFQQAQIAVIWTPLYFWFINRQSISQSPWSPSQMDKLDALESQLSYFLKNKYTEAYKAVVESFFFNCVLQYRTVCALSPQYDYLLAEMKSRQSKAIKLYIRYFGHAKTFCALFDMRIWRPLKHALSNKTIFFSLNRKIKKFLHLKAK